MLSQLSYTPIIKLLGFAFSIFGMIIFHFSFLHFSFATVRLHGRPKWTRTTLINLSLALLEKSRLRFIKGSLSDLVLLVGPSGLEPPTSCLSGTRSNLLSYEPMWLVWIFLHTWFSSWGSAFCTPSLVSALDYLPVQSPVKYFRHCRA